MRTQDAGADERLLLCEFGKATRHAKTTRPGCDVPPENSNHRKLECNYDRSAGFCIRT